MQRRGGEGIGGMVTCANAEHGQTLYRGGREKGSEKKEAIMTRKRAKQMTGEGQA